MINYLLSKTGRNIFLRKRLFWKKKKFYGSFSVCVWMMTSFFSAERNKKPEKNVINVRQPLFACACAFKTGWPDFFPIFSESTAPWLGKAGRTDVAFKGWPDVYEKIAQWLKNSPKCSPVSIVLRLRQNMWNEVFHNCMASSLIFIKMH
jgi:hypothetical protein